MPLYAQIKQLLHEQILNGELSPGTVLPTEHDLSNSLNVSRITVKRALDDLARAGLLRRIQGKGTIVEPKRVTGDLDAVVGFSGLVRRHGLSPSAHILSVETRPADHALREAFGTASDTPMNIMYFRRLLGVRERPMAVVTSNVPEDLGNRMVALGVEDTSFYRLFQLITGRRVVRTEQVLAPIVATPEIAHLLGVALGSAHFHVRNTSYIEGGDPIELSVGVYSGDAIQWTATSYQLREEKGAAELQLVTASTHG
jgi:GntR family transcriptional regulator